MNNILSIKNLNKTYNNFKLENVNIDIPSGTIVGFIGENGLWNNKIVKRISGEYEKKIS